jgi:hypothetical protein
MNRELKEEWQGEYEGEEFLRRVVSAARNVARVAAPMVGTAVGGFLGGPLGAQLGSAAGRLAQRALREGELEGEWEKEWEGEFEIGLMTPHMKQAEYMAAAASRATTATEAEAMAGAATTAVLSPADLRALRTVLPHMVRGAAVLTRILHQSPATQPAVRAIPTIVQCTSLQLRRRVAAGRPITRRATARAMASQTRRVLGSPRTCSAAIRRNVRTTTIAIRSVTGGPYCRRQCLREPVTAE